MKEKYKKFKQLYGNIDFRNFNQSWIDLKWWQGCYPISRGCYNCCGGDKNKPFKFISFNTKKIEKGNIYFVTSNSEFFMELADNYRANAWKFMNNNQQADFAIVTKKPERLMVNYPFDFWPKNVFLHATIDEQKVKDRLDFCESSFLPYYGAFFEPLTEELNIDLSKYKKLKWIHSGGEFYSDIFCPETHRRRPSYYKWFKKIYDECEKNNIWFEMGQTGTYYYDENEKFHEIENFLEQERIGKSLPISKKQKFTFIKEVIC